MARRAAYWQRIRDALRDDPARTVANVPPELWPHQTVFFNRHAAHSVPYRLLVADEVGLGKTIEAGILAKPRINQRNGTSRRLLDHLLAQRMDPTTKSGGTYVPTTWPTTRNRCRCHG